MRKRWIIGILCMALAALAVGCAKKTNQNAAVTAQKTKGESGIAFFMTVSGCGRKHQDKFPLLN